MKYSFQPTTLLPADTFKAPVDTIVAAWNKIPEARPAKDHGDLAKESINAAIGSLICRDQTIQYTMRSSGEMDDIPKAGKHFIITPLGDGQEHYDYVTKREFLQLDSTRPIHEMIMALEYLRLA